MGGGPMVKKRAIRIGIVIVIFTLLHSTPGLALRTSVFFHGHPIVALTTEIEEYEPYSHQERTLFTQEKAKLYRLMPPPIEKDTQGHLYTWKVIKKVFVYYAHYYGEG